MLNHTLPSIEEFAAFLDGNLSQNEMRQFSQFAAHDESLHQLLNANTVVDKTLNSFTDADLQLPSDLVDSDFDLPTISSEYASTLVSLSPDPMDNMLVAACANDDISMFSETNQDDNTNIGEDMHNDLSQTTPNNDDFDNNGDLPDSFSDNIY